MNTCQRTHWMTFCEFCATVTAGSFSWLWDRSNYTNTAVFQLERGKNRRISNRLCEKYERISFVTIKLKLHVKCKYVGAWQNLWATAKCTQRLTWCVAVAECTENSIVNFTISLALSAGTLMASAGTPYRLVPARPPSLASDHARAAQVTVSGGDAATSSRSTRPSSLTAGIAHSVATS